MLTRGNSPGVECTACGTVAGNIANVYFIGPWQLQVQTVGSFAITSNCFCFRTAFST